MMRFLRVVPLLLVLMSVSATANSVTTIVLLPNDGSGDNFEFFQQSPGLTIGVDGGTPFEVFNAFGYAPGMSLGFSTDVFFSGGFITFGGTSHDLDFLSPGSLFMSSITLPTNGTPTFTTTVTLIFAAAAVNADTGQPVDIFGRGRGTATFTLRTDGNYYADGITATSTVPEPSTLGLLGTGVMSTLVVRKKFKVWH